MSPLAAVCPVHGPVESRSITAAISGGKIRLPRAYEPCTATGCTETARTIEGEYGFDAEGRAHGISAPTWCYEALAILWANTTVIVDCPVHGMRELRLAIRMDRVKMTGLEMRCPVCQLTSPVVDALHTFDSDGEALLFLRPTPEQLERLQDFVRWAKDAPADTPQEEVLERLALATEGAPGWFARILDQLSAKRGAAVLGLLGVIVPSMVAIGVALATSSNGVSEREVELIVERAVEDALRERDREVPATPTPPSQAPTPPGPLPTATEIPTPRTH